MHRLTESTGIIVFAPLNNAVAIVDVARSTSIITTTALLRSYKCKRDGESEVYNVGLSWLIHLNV
jgi:hypothetical protein